MIYTVTFNPSIDCVYTLATFRENTVNRAEKEQYYPGGKGLNVSLMLKELGVSSTALGFLAGSTGTAIEQMFAQTGGAADFIFLKEGISRINTKLSAETESEINGVGPIPAPDEMQRLIEKLQHIQKEDILVLAGSIPKSLSDQTYASLIQCLPHKETKTVVDTTGSLLFHTLKMRPFLIKPNQHELADFFQTNIRSKEELLHLIKKLGNMGARNVLVSMDADGAILLNEQGKIFEQAAPKGSLGSSVGAGDAMVAGFLAGYLQAGDFIYALRLGVAAGSATAFSPHLAKRRQIDEIFSVLSETKEIV